MPSNMRTMIIKIIHIITFKRNRPMIITASAINKIMRQVVLGVEFIANPIIVGCMKRHMLLQIFKFLRNSVNL